MTEPTLLDFTIFGFVGDLARAVIAVIMAWLTSRVLDLIGAHCPGPFSTIMGVLKYDPKALGLYYGLRIFGLFAVFGMVLS